MSEATMQLLEQASILITHVVAAFAAAALFGYKGRSRFMGFLLAILLGPIGVAVAILIGPATSATVVAD